MKHTVYLALGSNLGDRLANLQAALAGLPPAVVLRACSPVYETPPWGYLDQPPFLNQVVKAATDLPPADLLAYLKLLEAQLGRQPTVPYGPRVIDLDLLFYNQLVLESPALTIPHPRMAGRAFVLIPLADLAPDLFHPVLRMTVRQMLDQVDREGVNRFSPRGCEMNFE